jgi:hypothetical protein
MRQRILLLLTIVLASIGCHAQKNIPQQADSIKYWRVETTEKVEFIGEIIRTEDGLMTIRTQKYGEIKIRQADIRSIEQVAPETVFDRKIPRDNFHTAHYLWLSNGFGLKPGEVYYENILIIINQVSVGITKNLSVTAGTMPIYFLGGNTLPAWIMPKLSVPLGPKARFGASVLYGKSFILRDRYDGDGRHDFGIALGTFTFGSRENNVTIGGGQGLTGQIRNMPVLSLATMNKVGRSTYLITESYVINSRDTNPLCIVSVAGRRVFKRASIDYGGFTPLTRNAGSFIVIPWIGMSVPLGKQHLPD